MATQQLCGRRTRSGATCVDGPNGGPAAAVELVDGTWYCRQHAPAAKAVLRKRQDRGFGLCSVPECARPAAASGGKCVEHLAGERARSGTGAPIIGRVDGLGGHAYARKPAVLYLALFESVGMLKVGKSTPRGVRGRVRDSGEKLRGRRPQADIGLPVAWGIELFDRRPVLWAESERIEHASAGRLGFNTQCVSVDHTDGKEWLGHAQITTVDWPVQFRKAVAETLAFLGLDRDGAGEPVRLG